jgi:hypothetical protein
MAMKDREPDPKPLSELEPAPPTDIPASKIDLDDLPGVVASRAPEALPPRAIGLSILVAVLFLAAVVGAIVLFIAAFF